MPIIDEYDGFLVDLDGVVWLGRDPIEGSPETLARMLEAGKEVVFVTNNPTKRPEAYAERLQAARRSLQGRTILLGLPDNDPVVYRSARNIEGVQVAPVAEFNTYDVLKQRYLVLTREALAALKERVKNRPAGRRGKAAPESAATES